ncbi:hypothetical protein [Reyranella sp.]|uniref:hypothetical protein n=1 Tax=Reyranella sp. TaxID=1929291 RepID=UPI003D0E2440
MPVQFEIDHTARFVTVRAYGVVRLAEILDYFDALVVQNAMPYPKLFDAREADPDLTNDDVMTLGARVSAYAAMDPRGPVAAVAVTKKASAILQRFMNLGGAQRPMRLFSTIEEARAWLVSLG